MDNKDKTDTIKESDEVDTDNDLKVYIFEDYFKYIDQEDEPIYFHGFDVSG